MCIKFITNLVIYHHPFIHIHKIYSLSIFFQQISNSKSQSTSRRKDVYLFNLRKETTCKVFLMGILVWRDQSNIYFPPRNIFPQQFKDFAAQDDFQLLCGRDAASMRQLAGYGFGLPLSRVYAQLLGFWKFMMGGDSVYVCNYIYVIYFYMHIS